MADPVSSQAAPSGPTAWDEHGNPIAPGQSSPVSAAPAATAWDEHGNPLPAAPATGQAPPQPSVGQVLTQDTDKTSKEYLGYTGAAGVAGSTIKGLSDVGHETLAAVKGAVSSMDPRPQSEDEKTAFSTGGLGAMYIHRLLVNPAMSAAKALNPHEIAANIHEINQSKDPTGTYLEIAQKYASKGAALALTAAATHGVTKGIGAVSDAAEEAEGAESAAAAPKPGIVAKVLKGKEVAQPVAESAVRSGATAAAEDAGVTATPNGGIRTLLDKPIEDLAGNERAAYDTINEASGMDMKSLYDLKNKLQDALEDPTQIANEERLAKRLKTTNDQINAGEYAAKAGDIPGDALEKAKNMTQQRYAMEDAAKKLFNNEGVVKGNAAHGAPESIDIDQAIKSAEMLDKPSKFAPRGAPTRLEQAFGKQGAAALKQGLYDAQKTGQTAITPHRIGLLLAGAGITAAAGAAGAKAFKALSQ